MSMRTRTLLAWIAVGLVGLALAAGVTYAATQLSSQRIGLSAEPPSAGQELASPRTHHHRRDHDNNRASPAREQAEGQRGSDLDD
jgi:hypothetical protein